MILKLPHTAKTTKDLITNKQNHKLTAMIQQQQKSHINRKKIIINSRNKWQNDDQMKMLN